MKAVGYYRYSSDNQHEESIEQQQEAVRAYAKKNNIEIVKEYIDRAQSAVSDERPEFKNMAWDIMNDKIKVDMCLVYNTNRFARNRRDAIVYKYDFAEKGVEVISVTQYIGNVPGRAIFDAINEALDEEYSKNLSREVKAKMRQHATKGKHLGGTPPLGYDVAIIDGVKRYVINKHEAEAVRLIYDMKLNGFGYGYIIDELNSKGFRTKRGQPFGKNSIYEILMNEKYTGTFVYARASRNNYHKNNPEEEIIRVPGALPPIIDIDTWKTVQKIMENNKKVNPRRKGEVDFLLTGKIVCGECGGAYVGNSRVNRKKNLIHYLYTCNNRKRTKDCSNKEIRKEPIEYYVLNEIERIFFSQEVNKIVEEYEKLYQETFNNINKEKERFNNQLNGIKQKIDRLYDAIENGLGNPETYSRIKKLAKEKEELEFNLKLVEKRKMPLTKKEILQFIEENKKAASEKSDPADSKYLINLFVNRIILTPNDIQVEYKFGVDNAGGPDPHLTLSASILRASLYENYWGGGALEII